jgi:PAS domain S-box-containing protein
MQSNNNTDSAETASTETIQAPEGPAAGEPAPVSLHQSLRRANTATFVAEERFRLLVESVMDYGIFMLDPDGYIQSWNAGAERIKGYSAQEIIGRHFSVFYTPEDLMRDHPREELEIAARTGRFEEEGWRVRKNGMRFWANVVITALRDPSGQLVGFGKVTRDLTERKELEECLRESEERARRMFEGVKDYAMIMLDPEGRIVSWNEGARRIKGYEPHEILGQYFAKFYPEEDVQMGKCEYELKEAAESGRFEDEGWRIRKDGTRFWASVVITAVRDDAGKLIGYSKVTRDMTDRKRSDDLLRMAYASLEKRVEERTRQLQATNAQLQEAVRMRDEFLSIASHELRTPLTPLKLQIQNLTHSIRRRQFSQLGEERLGRMADVCDKAITRLAHLIDDLLDISRIEMGKLSLSYETFDLAELARELVERYRSEILASGSPVGVQADGPVVGSFDRLRVEQVVLNLLTNALKYGARKPVEIRVGIDGDRARITVRDQGIGIARKDHSRIFDRFERVEGSGGNIGGLGLGLYITRQIVQAHGGEIGVESASAGGSTFTVTLPIRHP